MNVAFTKTSEITGSHKQSQVLTSQSARNRGTAHLPEGGTGFTLCGKRISRTAEVDDNDQNLKACKTCKRRLGVIQRTHPERLRNFLLPSPNM